LDDNVGDTDPQQTGVKPLACNRAPHDKSATAKVAAGVLRQVGEILKDEPKLNMILARGFAKAPNWPTFNDRWKVKSAAVAGYPMYRGVARLFGMELLGGKPTTAADVCAEAAKATATHNFVFAHFKYTDKTGEDGDIAGKVNRIEEMDAALPTLLAANPDVLLITGDHSTPPSIKAHSWHPVPLLMKGPFLRGGDGRPFDEVSCRHGQIGSIRSQEMLPLALAHAGKLEKFGA